MVHITPFKKGKDMSVFSRINVDVKKPFAGIEKMSAFWKMNYAKIIVSDKHITFRLTFF